MSPTRRSTPTARSHARWCSRAPRRSSKRRSSRSANRSMSTRVSFDRVADVYDRTRAMPPDATATVAAGIAAVLRDVAPNPRLLEAGLGTGRIAVPLLEAGVRVVGIDIATATLAQARRKRADLAVVVADATAPPFRNAS